ncbi:uncharacterized protein J4E92_004205 [Alternaria infectoria]|uniref:uncharacterized protein n=1 Tax=Alternaria infectoria TaxID=45303 RepID=UPI00221EEDBD|nr:uncharacterized protein J4E92_004205 [Alternaria infectoria]KAI4932304.1 hypothetical protein J4E92_004205 [Alternaria infectoria]
MPRDPTYHNVEKTRRHALKPYDRDASDNQVVTGDADISDVEAAGDDEGSGGDDITSSADDSSDAESSSDDDEYAINSEHADEGEEANSDQDSDSEEEASDVEDAIDDGIDDEDEDMEKPINIFNPSDSSVNCTDMGESYASGLPNEYSPPASDSGGRDLDKWKERLEENGFKTSNNPPDEEYLSGAREASVAYWHADGGGHVVAMDGGDNDATYTYSDHQGRVDEDVTEEVNEARRDGRIAFYVTRPNFDDREREQQQEDAYEDDEEEEGGDEAYGDDGDYGMDNGWNKYR